MDFLRVPAVFSEEVEKKGGGTEQVPFIRPEGGRAGARNGAGHGVSPEACLPEKGCR